MATLQTSAKWFQLGGSAYTNARLQEDRNPPRFMKWKIKSLGQLPLHDIYRYVRYDRLLHIFIVVAIIQLILRFNLIVGFFWELNLA